MEKGDRKEKKNKKKTGIGHKGGEKRGTGGEIKGIGRENVSLG